MAILGPDMIVIRAAALVLVGASALFHPAAATAQNIALQIQHCIDYTADKATRLPACTAAIESGRVPELAPFLYVRGNLYLDQGEVAAGIVDFNRVLEFAPEDSLAHYLVGTGYQTTKEYALALHHFDESIRLNSENSPAYNNKAWLLATAGDYDGRDGNAAIAAASRAVELNDTAVYRDTLAAAYAEAGDFDRAVEEQERAVIGLEEYGDAAVLRGAEERLELYRQGLPYRE